ncbi:hypothetical protein ACX0G9_07985 [Flavitalea flava]
MNVIEKKSVTAEKSLSVSNYVTKQQVETFIGTYKQNTWVHNTERIGKEDALSSWYSLNELEALIENIKVHGGNGVRMHFGIYPEGFAGEPELSGRQALVMVGTRSSDGTARTSKELYIGGENKLLAFVGMHPCPAFCPFPYPPTPPAVLQAPITRTLVDMGDKGFSVV